MLQGLCQPWRFTQTEVYCHQFTQNMNRSSFQLYYLRHVKFACIFFICLTLYLAGSLLVCLHTSTGELDYPQRKNFTGINFANSSGVAP